jgi:MYXO-CTERM domain-containing protein
LSDNVRFRGNRAISVDLILLKKKNVCYPPLNGGRLWVSRAYFEKGSDVDQFKNMLVATAMASAALLVTSSGKATVVDLTTSPSFGVINNARFETSDFRSAGTGVIDSFVRLQANGTERGYNTSGRPTAFDEKTAGTFTRNLQLSEVPTRLIGGISYYEFILDINQTNSNPLLTLDEVKIFTSATGSQTTSNVDSLGTPRYNMDGGAVDGDSSVELNYTLASGSGQGDMNMYIPVSNFAGALQTDFVYLYSEFGIPNPTNDGIEEWAIRTANPVNPPEVPLPTGAAMGLAGLTGLGLIRRRASR